MNNKDRQYTDQRKKDKTANNEQSNPNLNPNLHACVPDG